MATMQETRKFRQSGFPGPVRLKSEPPPAPKQKEEDEPRELSSQEEEEVDQLMGGPSEPFEDEVSEEMVSLASRQDWSEHETNHLTSRGTPDRRYRENRALTAEDVGNPYYRKARTAPVVHGIHVTSDGSPDRRYKENRNLSDEEVEIKKAQLILEKHGIASQGGTNRH